MTTDGTTAGLSSYPPEETWDHVESLDAAAWPTKVRRAHRLVPTTCFNCEANCGLLAWATRFTRPVGAGTALKARPPSTRLRTPSGSCTR